jgi:integrase
MAWIEKIRLKSTCKFRAVEWFWDVSRCRERKVPGPLCVTRREAKKHARLLEAQKLAGRGVPAGQLRVGQYFATWLPMHAGTARLKRSTLKRNTDILQQFVAAFGNARLDRLQPEGITSYFLGLYERGRSASTALRHYAVLHKALSDAVRDGKLNANPLDRVPRPKKSTRKRVPWTREQAEKFLTEAWHTSRHYVLYLLALNTGLRQGELIGLHWAEVDLDRSRLFVRYCATRTGGTLDKDNTPKTADSEAPITLQPKVVATLRKLREYQEEERERLGAAYENNDLVFCQRNGQYLHGGNLTRRDFYQIIKRADIPRITFHDLRHTHLSLLDEAGAPIAVIRDRARHSSASQTLSYTHARLEMQRTAADLVVLGPEEEKESE